MNITKNIFFLQFTKYCRAWFEFLIFAKKKEITAYHIVILMMFGRHIWPQPLAWHQPQLECTENVSCKKKQERVLSRGLDSRKLQDEWLVVFVLDKYSKAFISFVYTGEKDMLSHMCLWYPYLLSFNNFSYMVENPCQATLVNFSFANFGWHFISFQLTSTNIKYSQSAGPKPNIFEKNSWILLFLESHQ